jgi:NHL repeat-containing protein
VRSHAQASSAGSTRHQAIAPPLRGTGRLAITVLVAVAACLSLAPAASASQEVVDHFGTEIFTSSGAQLGGDFANPAGVAVNDTGAGPAGKGDIYVVDEGNNRIERFDSVGKFISAWGANVIHRNETQWIVAETVGGTYTLTFDGSTTAPIFHQATAEAIRNALGALPSVGGNANVSVSGSPSSYYTVTFIGVLAGTDVSEMTADTSGLSGSPRTVGVFTAENGSGGGGSDFEVCTVASLCGAGAATGGNGTTAGNGALNQPQSVAVDNDTGNVYVSDRGNRRIDEYEGDGTFIRSFGWDVDADEPGTGYEVCPAANVCKAGIGGSGVGQVGTGTGGFGIAVSPANGEASVGTVFLADGGNRRVDTFALDGSSPSSFGSAALFDAEQPREVAVDSRGIVYASNSVNGGEIERYDSQNANGGGTTFLAPISASAHEVQEITLGSGEGYYSLTCPNGDPTGQIWHAQGIFLNEVLHQSCGGKFTITEVGIHKFRVTFENPYGETDVPQMSCTVIEGISNECSVGTLVEGHVGTLLNGEGSPLATSGLTVHPDSDGGGSDGDILYVLRRTQISGVLRTVVQQIGPVNAPGLATAPAATDDTHGNGAGFTFANDVALNDAQGQLLISSSLTVQGVLPHRVYILEDAASIPTPLAGVDEVKTVTETTALLSGVVDPGDARIACKFQYSTDQSSWIDVDINGAMASGSLIAGRKKFFVTSGAGDLSVGDVVSAANDALPPNTEISEINNGVVTLSQAATATGSTKLIVPGCASLDSHGGPQSIEVEATGLDPNTRYYVRLAVARPFVENSTTLSPSVRSFNTLAGPPMLSDVGAIQVTDASARLVGTIDPRNSATGYHFEYGTTPDLGSSTPSVAIGGGTAPVTVSQVVGGLDKDTDHWFRLVATNLSGTAQSSSNSFHTRAVPPPPMSPGNCANEAIRQAQSSTYLPDCRAYEMVSPPDKNQGGVDQGGVLGQKLFSVSRDGDATAFCTTALFGDPPSEQGYKCAPYVSRRGPSGWATSDPFPRYCVRDIDGIGFGWQKTILSPDFDHAIVQQPETTACEFPALHPTATLGAHNFYVEDLTEDPVAYHLTSPRDAEAFPGFLSATAAAGDDDFDHIVYASFANQTDPPDSPATNDKFSRIYEWARPGPDCTPSASSYDATIGGCLSLISKSPAGAPFTDDSGLVGDYGIGQSGNVVVSSVSADGSRVYFANSTAADDVPTLSECLPGACELYMRENGLQPQSPISGGQCTDAALACTHHVSAPECQISCGAAESGDHFVWASPAGDIALFISCAKLTDASAASGGGCQASTSAPRAPLSYKLYRWDRNAPPGNRLIDLSIDGEPAAGDSAPQPQNPDGVPISGDQPHVVGVIGVSADETAAPGSDAAPGNTAYFVTGGQIVSGEATGHGLKLYRWRNNGGDARVDYLGPYVPAHSQGVTGGGKGSQGALGEPSLLFDINASSLQATTTPDGSYLTIKTIVAYDRAADRDIDADIYRWSQVDGWTCVSCQLPGVPSAGDVNSILTQLPGFDEPNSRTPKILTSDDGKQVFFSTPDALVPADVNGEVSCPIAFDSELFGSGTIRACDDVYEWNDGTLSLISTGAGSKPSVFLGASRDGESAFFYTQQRLVGWDVDLGADIYVARVGGGFQEPAAQPPICEGESCRGGGSTAPDVSGAGSAAFQGPGDPQVKPPGRSCPKGKRSVRRGGKVRCVRRSARGPKRHRGANNDRRAAR